MYQLFQYCLNRVQQLSIWNILQWGFFSIAFFVVISMWLFALQRIDYDKEIALQNANLTNKNLNLIVAENFTQLLSRSDIYKLIAHSWLTLSPAEAESKIKAILASDQVFTRIAIFDENGKIRFASSPSKGDARLKPEVMRLLNHQQRWQVPVMSVGEISSESSELWHIPLLIPIFNHENKNGVLLIILDLGYALKLYQNIDIGETGIIHLLKSNGQELVQVRRSGIEIMNPNWMKLALDAKHLSDDNWVGEIKIHEAPSMASLKHIQPYPFYILVSREINDILREHQSLKQKYFVVLTLFSLMLLGGAFWLNLMMQWQRRSFNMLAKSEDEKNLLIANLEGERSRALDIASKDHLTGLCNRRMFMELGASHLIRNKRARSFSAVLFIDLDRFKSINDSLGHHIGDLLLKTVATRLQQMLRASDITSRFGGDEFVIMLTELEKESDVVEIAEKIVSTIAAPCLNLDGHDIQILASIGIAISPRDGNDLQALIRHADLAMYQAKQSKSGSYAFFDPSLNSTNILQFELEQRFTSALLNDEFVLHFQPKVEVSGFKIVGLEALIRWNHPQQGLIYPSEFIPLAENTGHILDLGMWVIRAACQQIRLWKDKQIPVVRVAVNVSAQQLKDDTLAGYIDACIKKFGLAHQDLEIEITETSLIDNFDEVKSKLKKIKATGVTVALDDFGNGFSSLSYIKTLPIDVIKIDKAFIADIKNSHDDAIIVNSTITLAHNLGKQVVAEGVETIDQLVHLKTAGCDQVQGYYFSRAVSAEKAEALMIKEVLFHNET